LKRLYRLWWVVALCGLVACQAAATPTSAPSPTPVPTATPVPAVPTATPAGEDPKQEPTAMAEGAADAEPQWQIPRVRETDWGEGNPDAGLVVVEYSDFQ
jgi:hypothetical protein